MCNTMNKDENEGKVEISVNTKDQTLHTSPSAIEFDVSDQGYIPIFEDSNPGKLLISDIIY
jgi:hypothetical protein